MEEFVRLSLWYVHRVLTENERGFVDAINHRVDIYRNTHFFDGEHHPAQGHVDPRWGRLLAELRAIYLQNRPEQSAPVFEAEAVALLRPHMRQAHWEQERREGRPYECWTCDDAKQGWVTLHVINVYRPRSPLSDMHIPFTASLIRLLRNSADRQPANHLVRCGSWLNSVPSFAALFPPCWLADAELIDQIGYTMNHWGQFIDRNGRFHERNAARFRQTGRLPFPCLMCQCPLPRVLSHLEKNFPEAIRYNAEKRVDGA